MDNLLLFIISYIVMFIIYLTSIIISFKKKKILESIQVKFLIARFKFNKKDLNPKKIGIIICIIDPLIISLTGTIVSLPKWNYMIEIILGFILLMLFIYSFYEIIGRIIERGIKNGKHKRNRKKVD